MSGPFGSSQWMYNAGGDFYDHEIDNSLRFNDDDSARLNWTPASAPTSRTTMTASVWVKRGLLTDSMAMFGTSDNYENISFFSDDQIRITGPYMSGQQGIYVTNALFRDPSAWYHIVVAYDTTNATASDRMRLFVNGERITSFSQQTNSNLNNTTTQLGVSGQLNGIGTTGGSGSGSLFDGYLSDIYFIDGQALDPTSFGEYKSGIWIPKAYSGTYGTNGYHLEFAGNSNDSSGNSNNWSATNISAHDYMPDSPTNNFSTLNSIDNAQGATLSEGSLRAANASATDKQYHATFGMITGKWYWEVRINTVGNRNQIGIWSDEDPATTSLPDNYAYLGVGNGSQSTSGTYNSGAVTASAGDILSFAFDADAGELYTQINGTPDTASTASFTGLASDTYLAGGRETGGTVGNNTYNFGQDSSFAGATTAQGNTDANGIGDFYYSVPSGFLALCTANLPEPVVGPLGDSLSDENFNTVLYTGNGSTNAITGVGFQPDFLWLKARSSSGYDNVLQDVIRGSTNQLYSNSTQDEVSDTDAITSFDTDGFTSGADITTNNSGVTYVAWNWKAGGTASSNTDGSITSQVSANTDAGFSIVSYTGTGSAATVGHGLNVVPSLVIWKKRNGSTNWPTQSTLWADQKELVLNSTSGLSGTDSRLSTQSSWTSTTLDLGTYGDQNGSGGTYIAYCFHSVDGYSKVGSYTGNGSTDGTFVFTGFHPSWIMIRRTDSGNNWFVLDDARDTFNLSNKQLLPNSSAAESTGTDCNVDMLSNGFKMRTALDASNANGGTYIYLAFAENPFKYANAR